MVHLRQCYPLIACAVFALFATLIRQIGERQAWRNDEQSSELIWGKQFSCPKWEQWRSSYIQCLLAFYQSIQWETLSDNLWDYWRLKHADCLMANNVTDVVKTFRLLINTNTAGSGGEFKAAVQPPGGYGNQPCVVVTLGVGGEILQERKMKTANPTCRFFGADPIKQYGQIYSAVGTYFETAVGANTGLFNSSIKDGPGGTDYTFKVVPMTDLVSFLQNNVNESVIDHLWMDNEGPEYKLLPLMTRGGILDKNNITICQINAELHGPLEPYNMTTKKFGNMILSLTENSDYIVLSPKKSPNPAFFLNAFNPYCVKKFLGDWCA